MEEELNMEVGTKEIKKLQPAKVKIGEVNIEEVKFGTKTNRKVVCGCLHPAREEAVRISGVRYELNGKLITAGLWFNKDDEGKIQKGSATAVMMEKLEVTKLIDLKGKEVETVVDDKGYLIFKIY